MYEFTWTHGFCAGAAATTILIAILCLYAVIYHSGTISQIEEQREP